MGADLRATDLYAVGSFDPDHDAVMRIGVGLQPTGLTRGEAPGGGPILSVGIKRAPARRPANMPRLARTCGGANQWYDGVRATFETES